MNYTSLHIKLPTKERTMKTRTQQEKLALEEIRLKKVLNKIRRARKQLDEEKLLPNGSTK